MRGKNVGVLAGTYNCLSLVGGAYNNGFGTPAFICPPGLSASQLTYLASCNSAGQYQALAVTLQGGMTDTNNPNRQELFGTQIASSTQYCTIDGFVVTGANDKCMAVGGNTGNNVTPIAPGITVQNCYLYGVQSTSSGANSSGITCYACIDVTVQNCYVTDIINSNSRNSGIETWSSKGSQILYNTVVMSNSGASPIYVKAWQNKDVTIAYNYVDASAAPSLGDSGATAWDLNGVYGTDSSSFHHNIVLVGAGVSGCFEDDVAGPNELSITENRSFYNNTFVCPGGTWANYGLWSEASGASGLNVSIYNNIFARTGSGPGRGDISLQADTPYLVDYNLYYTTFNCAIYPAGSNSGWTNYTSLASWRSALNSSCIGRDAHAVQGVPTFAGGTPTLPAQAYQLTSTSPGYGAGSSNGQTSGSACSMGAWDGTVTRIGCSFAPGVTTTVPTVPNAPVLTVS
jgi:hypothetical protein